MSEQSDYNKRINTEGGVKSLNSEDIAVMFNTATLRFFPLSENEAKQHYTDLCKNKEIRVSKDSFWFYGLMDYNGRIGITEYFWLTKEHNIFISWFFWLARLVNKNFGYGLSWTAEPVNEIDRENIDRVFKDLFNAENDSLTLENKERLIKSIIPSVKFVD